MALQQSLLEFMQAASHRDNTGSRYSNAIVAQSLAGPSNFDAAPAFDLGATTEKLQGVQEEDLFLYSRKNVSLAKGDRATYSVFSGTVDYEDIYEWNLEDQLRIDGFGNAQRSASSESDQSAKDNIWHALRLRNSTAFPWTSAPAMVISGTKPLSQDTLSYTPKGATSSLKLTVATDIRASHEENEVDRLRNISKRQGYTFDQITVEGKLIIKNYKNKDVRLSVASRVRGAVESQTDSGKVDKLAEAIAVDNPLSRMTWEVTL